MGVLGIGMGLIVSQLGNVVQSAVGDEDRSEAGGLQFTAQQLGAAMGTALIGAIVISGLVAGFSGKVSEDPRVSAAVKQQVGIKLEGDVSFVSIDQVAAGARDGGPRRADDRGDHRQLRRRAADGAEDGAAGRRSARLRGVLHDPRPAVRGAGGKTPACGLRLRNARAVTGFVSGLEFHVQGPEITFTA